MKLLQLLASTLCATSLAIADIAPMKFDILRGTDMSSAKKKPRLLKRDAGDIVFSDVLYQEKSFYSANITIAGTEFQVQLDTGSSDLWVYGADNPFCASNGGVVVDHIDQSSTVVTPAEATLDCEAYGIFDIDNEDFVTEDQLLFADYGDGSFAEGVYGRSTVSFGNATLEGFMFGVANLSNSSVPVCGLGFEVGEFSLDPEMPTYSPGGSFMYQNLPSAMKQTGLIKRTAFSLWIDGESSEGYILFGAIDHSKYSGELVTLPLLITDNSSQPNAYQVSLNTVILSDGDSEVDVMVNETSVLLDSGTSEAYLPNDAVENIAEALRAKYSDDQGTYVLDCPKESTNITITFTFDGIDIQIPLESFLSATDSSGEKCALMIYPGGGTNILGDVFLQNVYVVFDQDGLQARIAPVDNNNDSADIEILDSVKTPSGGYNNETLTATASWDGTLATTEDQAITKSLSSYLSSDYGLSTSESATASQSASSSSKNLCGKVYSTFTISGLVSFILMMAL